MDKEIKRILVIKPSSLGDILHVFPALQLLRERYPASELDFLVHPAFADILDYSPFPVSRRILFDRRRLGRVRTFGPAFRRVCTELRRERYDLIIDFQGLLRSALFARIARGGPVIGFAAPREPLARLAYAQALTVPAGHAVEKNVGLVNAFLGTDAAVPGLRLAGNPANLAQLERVAGGALPPELVALIPGARWATKRFPPTLFAEIVRRVHEARPEAVYAVVGSAADRDAEAAIRMALGPDFPLLELTGRTSLGGMMEVLRHAGVTLSNDSGPMHAAAALGRPVFGFFGPTDPDRTGPYGARHRVYQLNMACARCLRRECPEQRPGCHFLDPAIIAEDVIKTLTTGE